MKSFKIYKNIRKTAMIMGLPIGMFAVMMTSVIGSLLIIIFSFSFLMIVMVMILNAALFILLTHLSKNANLGDFKNVFPNSISNKKPSIQDYE